MWEKAESGIFASNLEGRIRRFSDLIHNGVRTGDVYAPPATGHRIVSQTVDTAGVGPARFQNGVQSGGQGAAALNRLRDPASFFDVDGSLVHSTETRQPCIDSASSIVGAGVSSVRFRPRNTQRYERRKRELREGRLAREAVTTASTTHEVRIDKRAVMCRAYARLE